MTRTMRRRWSVLGFTAAASLMWELRGTTEVVVTTAAVSTGNIERRIVAPGTLRAVATVQVGAQISGTIRSLDADLDSIVGAGQVLARLESSSVDAKLGEADASVMAAEASLSWRQTAADDARTKLTRAEYLAGKQMIARADLDEAQMAMDEASVNVNAADSEVARAKAAVDAARTARDQTIIRAPIAGIVVSRNVHVGQTIAASLESPVLFRIAADLSQMQLVVDLDESDMDGVHAGDAVTFDVDSYPNETFRGTVAEIGIAPIAEQTTTIIDVANPAERLKAGMTALVTLNGSRRSNVVRIPNSALAFRPPAEVLNAIGETDVPEMDAEGRVTNGELKHVWEYDGKRFISVGVRAGLTDDDWTELKAGPISTGDRLATGAVLERRWRN